MHTLRSPLCCFSLCFGERLVLPQYVALLPGASERRMYTDMRDPALHSMETEPGDWRCPG